MDRDVGTYSLCRYVPTVYPRYPHRLLLLSALPPKPTAYTFLHVYTPCTSQYLLPYCLPNLLPIHLSIHLSSLPFSLSPILPFSLSPLSPYPPHPPIPACAARDDPHEAEPRKGVLALALYASFFCLLFWAGKGGREGMEGMEHEMGDGVERRRGNYKALKR
jgi:hypothetical protein